MQQDLTKGSVKKHYFRYLYAAFGSAMISCIYGMVDSAVVGHYEGPNGTAALSVIMPIWTIIYSLGLLIGAGGSVLYGVQKGQGRLKEANACFSLCTLLACIVSILCWIGICAFETPLLYAFGADETLLPLAKQYLTAVKFAIPTYPITQFLAAFLRNDNAPGLATVSTLLGGIFNIFGDLFFVFVLDMGMFGAGLATAIGGGITVLCMLSHFLRKSNTLRLLHFQGFFRKSGQVLLNGFSAFAVDMSMGVITLLFNRQIMLYYGANALAVYGVIVQVSCIVQCCTYGAGNAAQPLLSVNYGANRFDRIRSTRKLGLITVFVFGGMWLAASLAFPNAFVKLFMTPTESVLAISADFLRIYSTSYLFLPLNIFATFYFQALMQSKTAMVVSLSRGVVLSGILVYALPAVFGKSALWLVMPITELCVGGYVLLKMLHSRFNSALHNSIS